MFNDKRQRIGGRMMVEWDYANPMNEGGGNGGPRPIYLPIGGRNQKAKPVCGSTPPFVRMRGNRRVNAK